MIPGWGRCPGEEIGYPLQYSWASQLVKNPPAMRENLGLIPGLGRSPGEGKGYPLPDSGQENSMDCALRVFVCDVYRFLWACECFPDSSVGKESACNAGDPSLIPGWGRSAGEGIGYPLQYSWASLVAQLVKNPPAISGDLGSIPGLGRSPGEGKGYPLQYSGLENSMDCIVHGVTKSWTRLRDFHFQRKGKNTIKGQMGRTKRVAFTCIHYHV